ncbi:Pre-mRNA-splicing factor cwf19 [Entomophthora muscae]|uniref:Pre-mRNA-splicing factor cwf19 n=1 Tax=Entomophthora muscae TaxID=34485 RepID=A0ACC2UDS8_9FUNG|nr:Pre-mRNA-splicing factor cwf19 [Entomophthora muscae]
MDRYNRSDDESSYSSRKHTSQYEVSPRDRSERTKHDRSNILDKRDPSDNETDSSENSDSHSKRHKSEKKSRSSKKKSKSKHKKKHSHKEHKHKKEKKLYYESGEEVNDLLEEESSKVKESKEPKIERESWMTMDGLELDAFTVVIFDSSLAINQQRSCNDSLSQDPRNAAVNISSVASLKSEDAVSIDSLNVLQARILKAQLMGSSNLAALEEEYELALASHKAGEKWNRSVVPSFDVRGKYVDIGTSSRPGGKTKEQDSGSALDQDIQALIQQEKYSTSKDHYDQLARNISKDSRYENTEEYQDERSSQLATHKHRSEYQKRMIATSDYKKTKRALDNCIFCSKDESSPATPIVSMGHHVYLALTSNSELVPGHCLIVPGEHLLTSLDAEDSTWLEIRNFMKCLMQMFAEQDKGVVFIETVLNLANCYHTVIECIPLPWGDADDAPAYFKEGLLEADEEWSRHSKVIDTKERTFRGSMTSQLPYFHVWFHPDGGYGHIIEDPARFPRYFGHEIIAGILNIDPMVWRRPTKYSLSEGKSRVEEFKTKNGWDKFDWTKMLD